MKKIYVSHAKILDYKKLYKAIEKCSDKYEFIFPHENTEKTVSSSKETIKGCKILIADISERATGLGIEMGWAESFDMPIISIFKKGTKVSSSADMISNILIEYDDYKDLSEQLTAILENFDQIMLMADK